MTTRWLTRSNSSIDQTHKTNTKNTNSLDLGHAHVRSAAVEAPSRAESARRMGQPTQRATNYTARSNIEPAQIFLHANGQSAPPSGSARDRDVGRGAGSHTPSTASESKVCQSYTHSNTKRNVRNQSTHTQILEYKMQVSNSSTDQTHNTNTKNRNSLDVVSCTCASSSWKIATCTIRLPVKSRIGPKRGFGLTPGELLTISKPNPYPKSEKPPARKWFSNPNL